MQTRIDELCLGLARFLGRIRLGKVFNLYLPTEVSFCLFTSLRLNQGPRVLHLLVGAMEKKEVTRGYKKKRPSVKKCDC